MGVTIRTARFAYRARILAISSQIWEGDDYVPQVIDEWLRIRDSEVAVAELNETVIAFASTVNLTSGYVWLEGIRTDGADRVLHQESDLRGRAAHRTLDVRR